MSPIRILHIVTTMDYGGVETLLMSIYRKIDREKVQFDFLCHNRIKSKFSEEIYSLGGKMFMVHGPRHGGVINYTKELRNFFLRHPEYRIIHAHMSYDSALSLYEARKAYIPIRIVHSHTAGVKTNLLHNVYVAFSKSICRKELTHAFACSEDAGKDLYGKRIFFRIITNGINVDDFSYDESKRNRCRKELDIKEDTILVGHVGRFDSSKNHEFLIHVFKALHQEQRNSKLLLVGDGEKKSEIQDLVNSKGLKDFVIFAGQHRNLTPYYCAMDAFVFPSIFEGLGIVTVEAQATGLPVVASFKVPKEAKITDKMVFLSLNQSYETWANTILETVGKSKYERAHYSKIVSDSPYNIRNTTKFLSDFYLQNWGSEV